MEILGNPGTGMTGRDIVGISTPKEGSETDGNVGSEGIGNDGGIEILGSPGIGIVGTHGTAIS
jgi:hypothetical protein